MMINQIKMEHHDTELFSSDLLSLDRLRLAIDSLAVFDILDKFFRGAEMFFEFRDRSTRVGVSSVSSSVCELESKEMFCLVWLLDADLLRDLDDERRREHDESFFSLGDFLFSLGEIMDI